MWEKGWKWSKRWLDIDSKNHRGDFIVLNVPEGREAMAGHMGEK